MISLLLPSSLSCAAIVGRVPLNHRPGRPPGRPTAGPVDRPTLSARRPPDAPLRSVRRSAFSPPSVCGPGPDAARARRRRQGQARTACGPGAVCLESPAILLSDLVRVHPGRPAAHPSATGWDEELRARTAGVRLQQPHGALRVIVEDGSIRMSDHAPPPAPIGNGVTGGPESARDGLEANRTNLTSYLI